MNRRQFFPALGVLLASPSALVKAAQAARERPEWIIVAERVPLADFLAWEGSTEGFWGASPYWHEDGRGKLALSPEDSQP